MERTSSIWSEPNHTFFRFLKRIEDRNLSKSIAILGCSDGTYVLPATRRGFNVFAIDTDRIALFGGTISICGIDTNVAGITSRIQTEGVENQVIVVNDNFITYNPRARFSGVFTSGSIHYQDNSRYPLSQIIDSIKSYVAEGGLLLMEYICRSNDDNDPLRHFLTGRELLQQFSVASWKVTSNKKKSYIEEANPRINLVHGITWGRLYAEKKLE